ncbi:AAA family ATPase [Streptomyces indicus]|uniref:AAA domain-containing protein n=1 Tax=Streptomyces indicus TaxID=417292 RepID=A0A1G9BS52_9ACTN|nr:AAA family ATPase [Streptomyces indicus]SDK42328.1 AAA domain-containing protein [Streptomyces indicus]
MLVWINGPFGGGKTQTAYELRRRLPGSVVCDPEHVGFGLHRMMPAGLRGDFQDLPAWRQGVYEVLDLTLAKHDGPVIVPMTVIEPAYFEETVGRLRERGHDVRHFALLAARETVLRRLRERAFGRALQLVAGKDAPLRRESFAVRRLDACLESLARPEFAEHLWTDAVTIPQVADRIAESAGLPLLPNTDGAVRGRLRRVATGVRHIRFD